MTDIVERLRNIARVKGYGSHAEAADEILRLRSELEQCQQAAFRAMEWQPIASLPESHKDGRKLVMWAPGFGLGALTLFWMDGKWREPKDCASLSVEPTHFLVPPPPPEGKT